MVMSLSLAVSAYPSTDTAEELPWAVFLRDTDGRTDGAI